MENKYVRGLLYIGGSLIALMILLYIGDTINKATSGFSETSLGTTPGGGLLTLWWAWLVIGGLALYVVYILMSDNSMFKISTQDVVMMALGAALYGVLSWIFNIVQVPSVSLVSLRPVVVIPIFFGFAFGPIVGFFTGAFGNILGDALSGWGVYPIWDFANGLMGFIPGLAGAYLHARKAGSSDNSTLQTILWISAAILAVGVVLPIVSPNVDFGGGAENLGAWWLIMLVVLLIVLGISLAPQFWPYLLILVTLGFAAAGVYNLIFPPEGLIEEGGSPVWGSITMFVLALLSGLGAFYLNSRTQAISKWLDDSDTKALAIWGTLAVIVGIGFAAMADIFYNGYSFTTAFLGEFVPAAGPNILFAVILTPLVYAAWKQTRAQTGR